MKLVCVYAGVMKGSVHRTPPALQKGAVYTFVGWGVPDSYGALGVLLAGIEAADPEYGFFPERFRPVVSRPTSIEVFEKLLNPSPERVKELGTIESNMDANDHRYSNA